MPSSRTPRPKKKPSAKSKGPAKSRSKSGSATASGISWKPKPALSRNVAALRRLGVDPDELASAPQIGALLREADRGIPGVIEAMRYSVSPDVVAFLEKYDTIPARDRQALPLEAIALAAELHPQTLLGGIMLAMREHSVNLVKVISISAHPDITRARVKYAQMPNGTRDRDALDTALGFLASPKGATFVTNVNVGKAKQDEDDEEDAAPLLEGDVEHLFPTVADMQERIAPLRSGLLGAGE